MWGNIILQIRDNIGAREAIMNLDEMASKFEHQVRVEHGSRMERAIGLQRGEYGFDPPLWRSGVCQLGRGSEERFLTVSRSGFEPFRHYYTGVVAGFR